MSKREKIENRAKKEVLALLNAKRFPRKRFATYELLYGYVYTYQIGDDPEEDFATKEEINCEGFSNEEIEIFYQELINAIYFHLKSELNATQIGHLILALDMLEGFKKNKEGELQLLKKVSPRVQYAFEIYVYVRFFYEYISNEGDEDPLRYGKIFIELLKEGEK